MAQGIGAARSVLIAAAALWFLGVLVATPFVLWWASDAGRIPGHLWFWSGYERRTWQWALLLGWLFGGVVAIATVVRWRRGPVREELLEELRERIAAHRAAAPRLPVVPAPTPEAPVSAPDAAMATPRVVGPDAGEVSDAGTRSRRRSRRLRRSAAV